MVDAVAGRGAATAAAATRLPTLFLGDLFAFGHPFLGNAVDGHALDISRPISVER